MSATAGPQRSKDNPGYGDCRCPCHFDHEDGMRTYHVTACCYPPALTPHSGHRTTEDRGQASCMACWLERREINTSVDG